MLHLTLLKNVSVDLISYNTCICILVFKTSRGKQAVTDITDAILLLRKRTLEDIYLGY